MKSRSAYLILSFLTLVGVMGLSESSGQRKPNKSRTQQQATPVNSPTPPPAATPTPTPSPDKLLKDLQETINGFGQGVVLAGQERTLNFSFSDACKYGCKDCTLRWDFEVSAVTVEKFTVQVALGAIDPKRISVDGTQVEFETNNGQTITVYTNNPARTDSTDAWHISIRSEDGAERVAGLLKRILNESCPKPSP